MKIDLIPGFSCVVMAPVKDGVDALKEATETGYKIIYILTANGDKYQRRTFGKGDDGQVRYSQRKVTTIPGIGSAGSDVKEEDHFLPAGKVPISLMWDIAKFFKAVIEKFGDKELEAMAWIMWNAERGYFLHIPTQKVAGSAVEYDWANLPTDSEGKPSRIIVDIHSHANFSAFFSGTDDRDDSNTVRYSGVFGFNRRPVPDMKFRFNFLEHKTPVAVNDIFAVPVVEVGETPADWLDKVQLTTPTVQYGRGNYGSHYGGGHYGDFGHGGHYSGGGFVHRSSRKKYEAPMPSNATGSGWKAGEEIWYLKNGGYITFDQWEIDYPKIIAERERKEAEKKAKAAGNTTEQGGQQGTRPLSLTGPQSPENLDGKLSPSQKEESSLQKLNSSENSESSKNSSETNFGNLGTQFPSNPFSRSFAREETETGTPSQTSNSSAPSTHLSSGREPQPEPEPQKSTTTLSTTNRSNSTSTTSPASTSPTDPLSAFTKPVAYISQDEDGYSTLTLVSVKSAADGTLKGEVTPSQGDSMTAMERAYDEAMYRRELAKSNAQGKAPEGVIPVEVPQLQAKPKTPTEAYRDEYLAGCAPLPVRTPSSQGSSEVSPLGGSFSAPTLQSTTRATGTLSSQAETPTLIPTLVRKPTTTLSQTTNLADTWLERRAREVRQNLNIPEVPTISARLEDKMHQRARQEDLLAANDEEDEQALLAGMPAWRELQSASVGESPISVWPDNTVVLRMEKNELPLDFDANCISFGKKLAGAKAVMDVAMEDLAGSGTLVRRTVQDLFEKVDEEERLPLFRTLAESLPPKARERLETDGL